ncbi:MAG: hypothetical protein LBR81_01325 [Prevotellaceae bacterium]|jgi:hypothetical protein|nr:hypothetical protein [Prevotellaceae bacterium]
MITYINNNKNPLIFSIVEEKEQIKRKKRNLPGKEADLNTIATEVAAVWAKHPKITLLWTDIEKFEQAVTTFAASYAEREDAKGTRQGVTQSLKGVNSEINSSVEQLKAHLAVAYTKRIAAAHYASLGIVKKRSGYKLPVDNDRRLYALEQLIKGLEKHGLSEGKLGTAYWKDILSRFTQLKKQAAEIDKNSALHVGIKTKQKLQIRKTLNALISVIKGNYPDSWKEELRVWGFQKEKY